MICSAFSRTIAVAGVLTIQFLCGSTGCQHVVNPFVDETISAEAITTPTAEGVRRGVKPEGMTDRTRPGDWPAITATGHSGTVSHWPLWYEDPFEDKGSDDGKFCWTWEDCLAYPYSTGRWVVNALALPISGIVTPPFTIMSSDGVLSRRLFTRMHDARVGPGPARDVGGAESVSVRGPTDPPRGHSSDDETSE